MEDLLRYLETLSRGLFLLVWNTALQSTTCDGSWGGVAGGIPAHAHRYCGEQCDVHPVVVTYWRACDFRTPGESLIRGYCMAQTKRAKLPLTTLKMHQLQLIRGTRMAHEYEQNPSDFYLFNDVNEYIDLVIDYVEHLRPDLVIERFVSQSPRELLIAPDWGLKNYEFTARVQKE